MKIKFRGKLIIGILVLATASFYVLMASGTSSKTKSPPDGVAVPIIMYHQVKPYKTGKDIITPWEMESDFKYLAANGYHTITMTDLIHSVNGAETLPENPIILTFDDGYYNNYIYVYPLLKKYNMKIVMSIIGKSTDDFSRVSDINLDYSHVTWDEINEMKQSGYVEIQNHTYNLHTNTRARIGCQKNKGESLDRYSQVLTGDLSKLQDEIVSHTGIVPNTFTYPYGRVSPESVPILKSLGFQASLTCDYGVNLIAKDPEVLFGLKRIARAHGTTVQQALNGAMKTLKYR